VLTDFAILSVTLSVTLFVADRRDWAVGTSRAWWRRSVLTRREDLRVGAVFLSCVAALIWVAIALSADHVSDRYPHSKSATGVVLHPEGNGVAVALFDRRLSPTPLMIVVDDLNIDAGDRLPLYRTSSGWQPKPSAEILAFPVFFAGALPLLAIVAYAASLRPATNRRLVTYRAVP
jgi:hypothetical protein